MRPPEGLISNSKNQSGRDFGGCRARFLLSTIVDMRANLNPARHRIILHAMKQHRPALVAALAILLLLANLAPATGQKSRRAPARRLSASTKYLVRDAIEKMDAARLAYESAHNMSDASKPIIAMTQAVGVLYRRLPEKHPVMVAFQRAASAFADASNVWGVQRGFRDSKESDVDEIRKRRGLSPGLPLAVYIDVIMKQAGDEIEAARLVALDAGVTL